MFSLNPLDTNQNQVTASGAEEDNTYEELPTSGLNVSNSTTVGDILSKSQLVLRRGLTLLIMVLILVAGIFASNFLTRLLKWVISWNRAGCQDAWRLRAAGPHFLQWITLVVSGLLLIARRTNPPIWLEIRQTWQTGWNSWQAGKAPKFTFPLTSTVVKTKPAMMDY